MKLDSLAQDVSFPWVIFSLDSLKFAIASTEVESMVLTTQVAEMTNSDPTLRGVFHFRDHPTPLIDLGMRLGMPSRAAEIEMFCAMLDARADDHRKWLAELESSIREDREFMLTTDPHACAFGRWYDAYVPETHSMKSLLAKFDEPHKRIHELGARLIELRRGDRADDALKLIEVCRQAELSMMIRLIDAVKTEFRDNRRETTIVFKASEKLAAVTVDSILRVETLSRFDGDESANYGYLNITDSRIIHSLARFEKSNEVVFVVDHEHLM